MFSDQASLIEQLTMMAHAVENGQLYSAYLDLQNIQRMFNEWASAEIEADPSKNFNIKTGESVR